MVITAIHYYRRGTIRVLGKAVESFRPGDFNGRGEIKKLSRKSLQRLALVASETEVNFKTMITLTYPREFGLNGQRVKSDLNKYLRVLRKHFPLVGYLWFLEFQVRGAPHFHLLVDCEVSNIDRALLALAWSDIVGVDNDNVFFVHNREKACGKIRKPDGAKRYCLKYALKPEQKKVPERYTFVGRFWGCNAKVLKSIPKPDYVKLSESELREFLKGQGNPACGVKVLPMVIFNREIVSRETIGQ